MGQRAYRQRIKLTSKGNIYTVSYCGRSWGARNMRHALELVKILYYVYEGVK